MRSILLIDDDPVVRSWASGILRKHGYNVIVAKDGREGIDLAKGQQPDLVITDFQMPGISGIEVLNKLKEMNAALPVIVLTAYGDAKLTIKSIQEGAFDFIEKPINSKELLQTIKNGLSAIELQELEESMGVSIKKKKDENIMVGKTPVMLNIFKNIGRVSNNNINLLITGETGVGKERLARLIHHTGPHSDKPLLLINFNSTDKSELKELFETGVKNGTLLLDEVGSMDLDTQLALLNLIESTNQQTAQGKKPHYRIISIDRSDLIDLSEQGLFLKELLYQLKVFVFEIPPLRERREDIPYILHHLIQQLNPELGKNINHVEDGVVPLLQSHQWPGNIRELKNVLMQAMVLSQSDTLQKKDIKIRGLPLATKEQKEVLKADLRPLADVEKEHIAQTLHLLRWNKQETAAVLGITRPTLNAKIEKYGLKKA